MKWIRIAAVSAATAFLARRALARTRRYAMRDHVVAIVGGGAREDDMRGRQILGGDAERAPAGDDRQLPGRARVPESLGDDSVG